MEREYELRDPIVPSFAYTNKFEECVVRLFADRYAARVFSVVPMRLDRVGEYLRYSIVKIQKIQPLSYLHLYLRYIFSQLLLMVYVSKYLKDTEDTAPCVSVSVS